jgi:hypothetical protein
MIKFIASDGIWYAVRHSLDKVVLDNQSVSSS